jgi:hypothetical protein
MESGNEFRQRAHAAFRRAQLRQGNGGACVECRAMAALD